MEHDLGVGAEKFQNSENKDHPSEEGINKPCPLCGTPRALPETMRLHGLDDFLTAIQPL